MLMSHFEEPKLSDDEEPPTEQDKRKKLVRHTHTKIILQAEVFISALQSASFRLLMTEMAPCYSLYAVWQPRNKIKTLPKNKQTYISVKPRDNRHLW